MDRFLPGNDNRPRMDHEFTKGGSSSMFIPSCPSFHPTHPSSDLYRLNRSPILRCAEPLVRPHRSANIWTIQNSPRPMANIATEKAR